MNKKILVITGLLLGSCAFTATAQKIYKVQKTQTAEETGNKITVRDFEKSIQTYNQSSNSTKATELLESLKQNMQYGISDAKNNIVQAKESQDDQREKAALVLTQKRGEIYNQFIGLIRKNPIDKNAVVSVLKKFAATL